LNLFEIKRMVLTIHDDLNRHALFGFRLDFFDETNVPGVWSS